MRDGKARRAKSKPLPVQAVLEHLITPPISTKPSEIVVRVFSQRLPIKEEWVVEYEKGFCDWDKGFGTSLREQMNCISSKPFDPNVLIFMVTGAVPYFLGRMILILLLGKVPEAFMLVAPSQIAWTFKDFQHTNPKHFKTSDYNELSDVECLVILMALCRIARHEAIVKYSGLKNLGPFALWLHRRASKSGKGRDGQVDNFLATFYSRTGVEPEVVREKVKRLKAKRRTGW